MVSSALGCDSSLSYLYAVPGSHTHQPIFPLQCQVVHFSIQFTHGDGLGVQHVGVHGLIELAGVLQPCSVEVLTGLLQGLK